MPPEWLSATDAAVCALLLPLAAWTLISGIDDIVVDGVGLLARISAKHRGRPSRRTVTRAEESRMAIFVPCWQEHRVIEDMLERNRASIIYENREFFVGVYPNDDLTVDAVRRLTERFDDVHLALCPHDGSTSKADCLNWIYQRMLLYESEAGVRFDVIVIHDAEDVIHPEALHWINWYSAEYDMVQVPVLPLPSKWSKWTHGVYCDEFAEYQARDMPARQYMGAFVPSNGVGTGFKRQVLEELAAAEGNRIFEPVCLTEDYENGLRLKLRGARQIFVPMGPQRMATREFFPCTFRTAVRQRTRWITGIALQTWGRHGWSHGLAVKYWLWRDRKGLIGNPASLLMNVVFAYGTLTWCAAEAGGYAWGLQLDAERSSTLLAATTVIGFYRLLYRAICVWPHFGPLFSLLSPVRVIVANCINSAATCNAVVRFAAARLRGQPLRWVKTDHQYPSPAALMRDRRKLGEILVGCGYIGEGQLELALSTKPAGRRIGEHLIDLGWLDEESLYEVLSLQSGLPQRWIDPVHIALPAARALPARVLEECQLIPFQVEEGRLYLAGPEPPTPEVEQVVRRFTTLKPKFWLVTPSNYSLLVDSLL